MGHEEINWSTLVQYLLPRKQESHKGDFGHSFLIGGNEGYLGAIIMASIAAARVGSGLISAILHTENAYLIPLCYPEIMAHAVTTPAQLTSLIESATVIGIGPGLGQDEWAQNLFETTLTCTQPLVVDADALNLLAQSPLQRDDWVLTPHVGEAARLLETNTKEITDHRLASVIALQKKYHGIVVLKGHKTLIATKNKVYQSNTGNPGMATGGTGDILTGIITGLIAQKLPLEIAAQIAVYVHGKAGDLAAQQGQRGLLATDLLPFVRQLVNPHE